MMTGLGMTGCRANWRPITGQEWYIEQQVAALKTSFGPRKSQMWQ